MPETILHRLFSAALLGCFAALVAACGNQGLEECERLLGEAKRYQEAALRCEEVYHASGVPRAGVLAAQAAYRLDHLEAVRGWSERLAGTSGEADALYRLGALLSKRGERAEAATVGERELALRLAAGEHRQAARALYGLFFLAWLDSRYLDALELARRSYEQAELGGDVEGEVRALEALHSVLYSVGDLPAARRALKRVRERLGPEAAGERPDLLLSEGTVLLDQGRPALARHRFEQALESTGEAAAETADPRFLRALRFNLVESCLEMDDVEAATEHLANAAEHLDEASRPVFALQEAKVALAGGRAGEAAESLRRALATSPAADLAWRLELHLGRAEEAQGRLEAAAAAYGRAIDAVEALRRELALDELKSWTLEAKREPYEALARLRAAEGGEPWLEVVERARARTFLDAFIVSASRPESGAETEGAAAAARAEALADLLPAIAASPVVAPRPAGELLEAVGERTLLTYFEAGDELWLSRLHRGRVENRRLAATPAEAAERVGRWLADPAGPAAAELGELLLPREWLPPAGEVLHLATDGALDRLSFAALPVGGRFLVESHAVAYVPSANALLAIEARQGMSAAESVVIAKPTVLADPAGDLPAAAREGREVAALLGVRAHLGDEASLERLRRSAAAEVLHLATHAGLGERGPWLALADGHLDPAGVLAEGLAPRRVVLASCASATRLQRDPWGSLAGAFLAAGSLSVVATLWSVEDAPTRSFIQRFYREGGAQDPAGALARSQRAALAAGRPPSEWAPFVVLGSGTPASSMP